VERDDGKFGHQNYFRSSGGWADFLPTIRRISQHWEIRDNLADRAFARRLQSVIPDVAKRPAVPQWNNGPRSNGTSMHLAQNCAAVLGQRHASDKDLEISRGRASG
ncbi:hypothetical protein ACCT30_44610, partial [Rhizobium ruizarguesonis]